MHPEFQGVSLGSATLAVTRVLVAVLLRVVSMAEHPLDTKDLPALAGTVYTARALCDKVPRTEVFNAGRGGAVQYLASVLLLDLFVVMVAKPSAPHLARTVDYRTLSLAIALFGVMRVIMPSAETLDIDRHTASKLAALVGSGQANGGEAKIGHRHCYAIVTTGIIIYHTIRANTYFAV